MKQFITLFFLMLLTTPFFAQNHGVCGTMPSPIADKMLDEALALRDKLDIYKSEDITYVPLLFHVIADDDGKNGVNEKRIFQAVCRLNEYYEGTDIQFYIKDGEFNYYNNTAILTDVQSNFANQHMLSLKSNHKYAVNIFVVQTIGTGQGGLGTILGYFSPPSNEDWIVIKKGELNYTSNTLAHELGHFFSLRHTFYGWEGAPFNQSDFPTIWPIAPVTSPGGPSTENVDGSNGTTAADKVSDTPPDYNFGIIWSDCNYTGGAKDPKGDLLDPSEKNQMSYFSGCDHTFSPIQQDLMHVNYNTSGRSYVRFSYVPEITKVTDELALVYPAEDEAAGTNVTLTWNAVNNAQYYYIELARTQNFSFDYQTFRTSATSFTIPQSLTPDVNYFWRVTPFNESGACGEVTSDKWKFNSAPVATSTIQEIDAWAIQPNPTSGAINIFIESNKGLTITAELFSLDGRVLHASQINTVSGKQHYPLNTMMAKGTYFLRLMSQKGVETRRVIVQ